MGATTDEVFEALSYLDLADMVSKQSGEIERLRAALIEERAKALYYQHNTVYRETGLRWEQRAPEALTYWCGIASDELRFAGLLPPE